MEKARILIIEDNPDNLDLLQYVLDRAGFSTSYAMDGKTGLVMARQERPDMILLDLSIPEIDGWELSRQIKADSELSSIIIVAVTGHALPGDRRHALECGCDGYISKPLNMVTFISQVKEYLGQPPAEN